MKLQRVRIVVVAESVEGRLLLDLLHAADLRHAVLVGSLAQARAICAAGEADLCISTLRNFTLDDPTCHSVESPAPAVPSVLLADVVTPHVRKTARKFGYAAMAAIDVPPRKLYRLVGGALQKARCRTSGDRRRGRLPCSRWSYRGESIRLKRVDPLPTSTADLTAMIALGKIKLSS